MTLWGVLPLCLAACSVYDESLLEPTLEGTSTGDDGGASIGGAGGSGGTGGGGMTSDATASGGASNVTSAASSDTTSSGGGATSGATTTTGSQQNTSNTADTGAGGSGGTTTTSSTAGAGGSSVTSGTGGAASSTSASATASSTTGSSCGQPDCCASDPNKTEPGECGCGEPDTDTDSDGTADCLDLCPNDPGKTEPGECGCGIPDTDSATVAGCVGLIAGLQHRYSFDNTGTVASDSVGSGNGIVVGTTLDGSGALDLADGDPEQYVELPSGLVSSLTNATVEAWFTYSTTSGWQRVFDFGSTNEAVAGEPGTGLTYLFFTPKTGGQSGSPRAIFTNDGFAGEVILTASSLSRNQEHHVVVSIDTAGNTLSLYINGTLASAQGFTAALSSLDDVNSWLGRSQYAVDAGFTGSIEEFRIYDIALSAAQVTTSFNAGPNPEFLE